ncbi:MAG TPA: 2-oxoglutarate dehydrogenase complex dihydrolipoyllysine-residue succinyltransferase [Tepidisphaeraceae bacterium]|jgi:2-oxoglutarate dehydrogenase E2 component (dihydrolipoamide succinyltransferase)|nr:2-oxoglutarate dehydrogenase complex dihydrolipoyllysine-residue succinyltransferase [Tepidisphaeraceae bacterium]
MVIQVKVPGLGESVKQATLLKWHKQDGEAVRADEPLCELESDKANADVPSPAAGVLRRKKKEGETVEVDEAIAEIDPTGVPTSKPVKAVEQKRAAAVSASPPNASQAISTSSGLAASATATLEEYSPAVRTLIAENRLDPKTIPATGPKGRLTKEDVEVYLAAPPPAMSRVEPPASFRPAPSAATEKKKDVAAVAPPLAAPASQTIMFDSTGIHREPMSRIRKRIAETLLQAQQNAAILTTFNEVDLTAVIELRNKFKDRFQEVHGISLGFMSFFARATVLALKEFPKVNAFIEGDNVVYHQFVHLGIAVSTDRGLAVPVLRNVEKMSFAKIETEIKRLATATRDGKLSLEELSGGTFTITNGGIFGSLLSTPILNPPQSGILGMHAIQKRPVVINDKIEIRSMMYLALSYDHRLVDGRESVSFLVRLRQFLEDPTRLMLEI